MMYVYSVMYLYLIVDSTLLLIILSCKSLLKLTLVVGNKVSNLCHKTQLFSTFAKDLVGNGGVRGQ